MPVVASSQIMESLFGDIKRFQSILQRCIEYLILEYGGRTSLPEHFRVLPDRIICICPMVLCESLLADLGYSAPDDLLGPLGLSMYSISTHDDIVDERPIDRQLVAGLLYAGNIASLHGISLLNFNGYPEIAKEVVHLVNLNHCFQTDIVSSLWVEPKDELEYLRAIQHTGYWAAIGPCVAVSYAGRPDLKDFAMKFGEHYGRMCQVYDDTREIDDDLQNGYYSLAISTAKKNGYYLNSSLGRAKAVKRSNEIAVQCFQQLSALCGSKFRQLCRLVKLMDQFGQQIAKT